MDNQYEVLSPWADVDHMPLRGISPRVTDLKGKKIGLFTNSKQAAPLIMTVVEKKLKEKFPDTDFIWYVPREKTNYIILQIKSDLNKSAFQEWVKGVDTIIAAVGD